MESLTTWQQFLLWVVPVVLAVTVHEMSHGFVALQFGDNTAKQSGRLSLNPLRHLDPVGSFLVPALFIFFTSFIFGWARPVPVDPRRLHNPRRDMVLVALAGPVSNLLMSILWAIVMRMGLWLGDYSVLAGDILIYAGAAGIFINAALMMLNLIPIPPLDGGRVLMGVVPPDLARSLAKIEPWGIPILVLLIFSGFLGKVLWPMMMLGMMTATHLTGLPIGLLTAALTQLFA